MNSTRIMARAASGIAVLLLAITISVVALAQESRHMQEVTAALLPPGRKSQLPPHPF